MGLSNDERFDGLIRNVMALHNTQRFETYSYESLNKMLDDVWASLTPARSNWLTGGSFDSEYFSEKNMVGTMFQQVLHHFQEIEEDYMTAYYKNNPVESYKNDYWPNTSSFLGGEYSRLYQVYCKTESAFYYLNRYNDAFSKAAPELSKILSNIQAVCLKEFGQDKIFAKAYFADIIFHKIKNNNLVANWFYKHNLHHHVNLKFIGDKTIFNIFNEFRKTKNISSQRMFRVVFLFLGSSFHYDHQHNDLYKMIDEHNKIKKEDFIDLDFVKALCEKSKSKHEKLRKSTTSQYKRYCNLTHEYLD